MCKMVKKADQLHQRMVQQEDQRQQRIYTMKKWNYTPIYPSGTPDTKYIDLYAKHRKFMPDPFHQLTCPKPDDNAIKKTKDYRQDKRNKRSEALKLNKDDACCVSVGMEGKSEKHCVDGHGIIPDVGCCC